jgi:hypothetical protein
VKTTRGSCRRFEFCYPQTDTLLLVEEADDEVLIRATRNTFSEEQKIAFVRSLASEGFISDSFRWSASIGRGSDGHVRWVVDYSWLELSEEVLAPSRQFMTRLFVGAGLLWLLLIWAFCLRYHP